MFAPTRATSQKLGTSWCGWCCMVVLDKTVQVTAQSKLPTSDEQYIKVMSLKNRKTVQWTPNTGPEDKESSEIVSVGWRQSWSHFTSFLSLRRERGKQTEVYNSKRRN